MLVISDAGPLHYRAVIGHADRLPMLYGAVAVPETVARELSHPHTPAAVRKLVAAAPPWLTVHSISHTDPELDNLGRGEREAIMLAGQIPADALLCGDLLARKAASQRHLKVIGTLGVLRDAAKQRMLDIRTVLDQLLLRPTSGLRSVRCRAGGSLARTGGVMSSSPSGPVPAGG